MELEQQLPTLSREGTMLDNAVHFLEYKQINEMQGCAPIANYNHHPATST
jgi:hypothetical protein